MYMEMLQTGLIFGGQFVVLADATGRRAENDSRA